MSILDLILFGLIGSTLFGVITGYWIAQVK